MEKFELIFRTENAAFDENPEGEVVRILLALAAKIESQGVTGLYQSVFDANGNVVGTFKATLTPVEA